MAESLRVGIVGSGYVGLVTGACLAHLGHRVTCVDRDEGRVEGLRAGRVPFYEPGLEDLLARGASRGTLGFAGLEGLAGLVEEAEVLFIAVGTPQREDGSADLSGVGEVARGIGRALARASRHRPLVVVNKSTVPVGSGDHVSVLIREGLGEGGGGAAERFFCVVSNPEFLREGSAIYDTLFPDRIVAGSDCGEALDALRSLYAPIIEQSFPTGLDPRPKVAVPFVTTDLASAEMIKYAANAFLATKISFINEVANLCELVGADVGEVAYGIGLDERIGPRFLCAGIGWGGSCLPKDVAAFRAAARAFGHLTPLLDATVAVNARQRELVIAKLRGGLHALEGKRVALLGLSFKPNTDDLREAPSLEIARALESMGACVVGYDPVCGKAAAERVAALEVVFDPYEALSGANAAVVVTEWEEVRGIDLRRARALMREPKLLVDGRNAFEPEAVREAGLTYEGFGRG